MKRFGGILIILLISVNLIAGLLEPLRGITWNRDEHLHNLLAAINHKKAKKAQEELLLVQDWSYDRLSFILNYAEQREWLMQHIDTNIVSKQIRDSFDIYLCKQADNWGYTAFQSNDYKRAYSHFYYSCKTKRRILGETNTDFIESFTNLGATLYIMGDYQRAYKTFNKLVHLYEYTFGKRDEHYARHLYNLGCILTKLGEYDKAERSLLESIKIWEENGKWSDPDYMMALNGLGTLYTTRGEYAKAEEYYNSALNIYTGSLEFLRSDLNFILTIENMGGVYGLLGDYQKEEFLYVNAAEIIEKAFGKEHILYAHFIKNVGTVCYNKAEYDKAETYYREALSVIEKIEGKNHTEYAELIAALGRIHKARKEYKQAEECFQEAVHINDSIYKGEHPECARLYFGLGDLFNIQVDIPRAKNYFLKALDIYGKTLGEHHLNYAQCLYRLGLIYFNGKDFKKAEECAVNSAGIRKELYLRSTEYMSEKQRELYWEQIHTAFGTFAQMAYRLPSLSDFAYNNELFTKGILLLSTQTVMQSVLESSDSLLISEWNQLNALKKENIALQEKDSMSDKLAEYNQQVEILDKELTRSSAAYRENLRQWSITWDSVRAALKPNQVAIEFMSAALNKDSTMYCALLLRHDNKQPELIPLFEEKEVASLLLTNNAASIDLTYNVRGNGLKLQQRIWSHILPYLQSEDEVFFSPTGLLHRIAIENLPYDTNRSMGDAYHLVRVSSTRELAMRHEALSHQTATLYGDIYYDVDTTELAAQSRRYPQLAHRSLVLDTLNRDRAEYLKETKEEIEQIQATLANQPIKIQVYTTTAANEESFKALSGTKQNILHLATHGFYWSDATAHQTQYFNQRSAIKNAQQPVAIDPLERCGLLFAGANNALSGHSDRLPSGVQDGILTAKEISLLDLREADIVVLSACETGLGDISGEGVFGLQRAFKMAGAQTILMALWQVNDEATRMLMTAFYRHYTAGESKRKAFRNAQQEVRSSKYKSPYFWAGFVLLD